MLYREVRDVLKGYVEYIALMQGLEVFIVRDKKLKEFQYWIHVEPDAAMNFDLKIMTAEVGDARNVVVLRFHKAHEYIAEFETVCHVKDFDLQYDYHVNTISISVYNIEQIHKVLSLFEEIGFFTR